MPSTISTPFLDSPAKRPAQLRLRDVLALPSLSGARLVAGEAGLDRPVLWSHVVDMPDPAPWVPARYFLLTTGYGWPAEPRRRGELIAALGAGEVAGVGLAVPRYLEAFSPAERAAADRCSLPLVEIPFEVPFARITEQLHRAIASEPYRIVERAQQIHQALMRAASREATLADLARILSPLIGRSVTFEDPNGKLLAACTIDDRSDAIRKETLERAQSPSAMLRALESSGVTRRLRDSDKPIRIPAMRDIGLAARVACPIRIGSKLVGVVWIIEGDEPLAELDHRAAEYAALVAAIHIAHQRELASLEASLGYASVLSLLESENDPEPAALERARLVGFDPKSAYRIAIVLLPDEPPLERKAIEQRERTARSARNVLQRYGAEQLVCVTLNRVPMFVPERVSLDEVLSALNDSTLTVVAGRTFTGASGARRSYREALSLLRYRNRKAVCSFDDVLVPRVIGGDRDARQTFLNDLLDPLLARRGGEGLVQAVLALARSGFRMREAALSLRIHPNTLRYRLNRASEILNVAFDVPDVRFALQLAAKLLDFDESPASR